MGPDSHEGIFYWRQWSCIRDGFDPWSVIFSLNCSSPAKPQSLYLVRL